MSQLSQLRQLAGGSPQVAISMLAQRNPRFVPFLQANMGKTPQQMLGSLGIDINDIRLQ